MNESVRSAAAPLSAVRALSVDNQRLFVVAVLLSIVPMWFGRYLPMVDLPGHAAVIAALQQIAAGNPTFTEAFEAHWTSPYLFAYALFYAAATVLPATVAAKLVVSLAVAATPLMTAVLLRAAGADERWRWLAIPASYSYAFYWGFISFILAVPLALLLLILTLRFDEAPSLRRGLIVAAMSIALFYAHIIATGFACMIAVAYLAAKNYRNPRQLLLRWLPYTAPIPFILFWFTSNETGAAESPITFGPLLHRLSLLVAQPAGAERVSALVVVITCAIVLLPPLAGSRLSRSPARWLPFVLGLLVFLTAPHYAFQTAYLYQRLGVFLVPLWLLMWDRPTATPSRLSKLAWLAMPLAVVWLFSNVARFASFARETQHFDVVLAAMEPGKRVAALVDRSTPLFALPVYLHFPSWYQAEKLGIVDFNFADFYTMVQYKQQDRPRITEELGWYPHLFDWKRNGGASYDYFMVKANFDAGPIIFKEADATFDLVAHSGWWWVYKKRQ